MPVLSSIAEIRMGATLRGRDATRPNPQGSYHFLRIGDITQEGTLHTTDFLRIEPNESVKEELWIRKGDVLFPNRGKRTTALVFPLDIPKVIVGPQFFLVRPHKQQLSPEYLAWYLRTTEAAAHFEARRQGTYVPIIQRGDLAGLDIPLPPLAVQQKVVGAAMLALEERKLSQSLLAARWCYANEKLLRIARKHCRAH